ncbi:hypothetical protein B0I37DRAFT_40790 [Chaetomium sp. MPI-CAGE-AT-0009]|nr:hypothetical protein B0I37DRAFT_40790 [Chaetomium sp. MPI-CAGE-AT-0009]
MAAPLRLRHLHLPSIHPHYVPYSLANRVQEHLRRQHLDFKDGSAASPPPPTLISFSPSPIYTLGRRQTGPLAAPEVARLTAPLQIAIPPSQKHASQNNATDVSIRPQLLHSPRGGLTTYHGPGQVVLWPVLDLKSAHHRHFTVKCYARLLETTTIATLHRLFGLDAFTTADPGVWVLASSPVLAYSQPQAPSPSQPMPQPQPPQSHPPNESSSPSQPTPNESSSPFESPPPHSESRSPAKIAALGVHLRRHITALGTAINITTPPGTGNETNERANPWARIVACGLAGRGVTSVAREVTPAGVDEMLGLWCGSGSWSVDLAGGGGGGDGGDGDGDGDGSREGVVARAWAGELAERIGLGQNGGDGVEVVQPGEVVRLMEELVDVTVAAGEGGEEVAAERVYLERVREVVVPGVE